jgi:protein-L-isoaspartate(D-aspartate) O-methyltransferase
LLKEMLNFKERREWLVRYHVARGILKTPSVIRAMKVVPREEFIPEDMRDQAYMDSPLPIGYGQTISAPHMVAIMNEALALKVGHKVLEIGAGSGYHAATVAEIVAPSNIDENKWGHVYTLEIIPELVEFARQNLKKTGYANRVTVIHADGSQGYPSKAPYDRIYVTAAAPRIPSPLFEQLKSEGIMLIPVGSPYFGQDLVRIRKRRDGSIEKQRLMPVAFVLLRGRYGWRT